MTYQEAEFPSSQTFKHSSLKKNCHSLQSLAILAKKFTLPLVTLLNAKVAPSKITIKITK